MSLLRLCLPFIVMADFATTAVIIAPRRCQGSVKHVHLAVGKDPTTQMTVSFASKWANPEISDFVPLGGVHIGTAPYALDRFVGEEEFPIHYTAAQIPNQNKIYYSPYQHHISIDDLEPNTTYYYVAVVGIRALGLEKLRDLPLRYHLSQHEGENEDNGRLLSLRKGTKRKLSPPPYDGSGKPCTEGHAVRSFTTAPIYTTATSTGPVTFAIVGDLGQFENSQKTLEHMRDHCEGINAVVLAGDLAYTDYDHRRWDTFFDFLDDYSIFGEVPLMIAAGNHDIDKQEYRNEIFQAYEARFRMPQVRPAELGVYDGPSGYLNMDKPPYPLPYEWGNAFYSFAYGPALHIVLSAYSSMEPDSTQYDWLLKELAGVDRDVTPWVLVTLHVPLYNSFSLHAHDLQITAARDHLEKLFIKYHVNLIFTGHIHAYQRTENVAHDRLTEDAPIHITIGAGGRQCEAPYKSAEPEEWVANRDASFYGYGKLTIFNQTHAEWKWIPLSTGAERDYNTVKGKNVQLPQLHHDQLVLENQYFLSLER